MTKKKPVPCEWAPHFEDEGCSVEATHACSFHGIATNARPYPYIMPERNMCDKHTGYFRLMIERNESAEQQKYLSIVPL